MSSSSEEGGSPRELNGKVETVPLVQFSTIVVPATSVTPEFLEQHRAICSACRTHVPHLRTRRLRVHPILSTVVCRTCEERLIAALVSTHGIDATQCQWCANPRPQEWDKLGARAADSGLREGGDRKTDVHDDGGMHCSDPLCGQFVCRSCLRANLTREQLALVRNANDSGQWKCFRCDSYLILGHQLYAATIAEYLRIRRQPVLLPPSAASWSLSADQPPQPQFQPSSGDDGPSACGEQELKIEQLGRRARSLVEACALFSFGPADLSAITHSLQELVMWAQNFLEPESLPVSGTQHETNSVDASSDYGEPMDVDDNSVVIDEHHQQELDDWVPDENSFQEECASGRWAVPTSSDHGRPTMDFDDKSAVIDALHQQKLNAPVPGKNPSQDMCASVAQHMEQLDRIRLLAKRINALRVSLTQINEYIIKSEQTPIRRL